MLCLEDIRKQWPGQPAPVLDGVNLTMQPGEAIWLQGRNGVGKTTLLRIAVGLITPDAGSVRVCGLDPKAERGQFQRRLGFVSTGYGGLYARLDVRFHLKFWADLAGLAPEVHEELIERSIERFELGELIRRRVDRLSMGQRQRVRLAMGFLHQPRVMLLDEPRNSLDTEGAEALAAAVDEVRGRGGCVLWCSPAGESIGFTPDRRCWIEGGALLTE